MTSVMKIIRRSVDCTPSFEQALNLNSDKLIKRWNILSICRKRAFLPFRMRLAETTWHFLSVIFVEYQVAASISLRRRSNGNRRSLGWNNKCKRLRSPLQRRTPPTKTIEHVHSNAHKVHNIHWNKLNVFFDKAPRRRMTQFHRKHHRMNRWSSTTATVLRRQRQKWTPTDHFFPCKFNNV